MRSTDTIRRVEFPADSLVRVLDDGRVGHVTSTTASHGLFTYQVDFADGSSDLIAETRLRYEKALRALEAQAVKREHRAAQRAADEEAIRKAALRTEARKEKARAKAAAEKREKAEEEGRIKAEGRASALKRINRALDSDFLGADAAYAHLSDMGVAEAEYADLKAAFVQRWVHDVLHETVDHEQAGAIAATGGDVKVVARAGSGKTRTLTTRAAFLQKHCGVLPQELMLLAFNTKAAGEMVERLRAALGEDTPHAMTFHALAYAIVHPDEDLLFDDRAADQLGLSREIQEVIDQHIRSEEHRDQIRDLMLAHYRDDWQRIVERGVGLSIAEFVEYRQSLPRETLRGEFVKSYGEREIANTLFQYDVPYFYERSHRWNGVNYKPDFMVPCPGGGVVIEYFGLAGDPDYDEMSSAKRGYWAEKQGWTLLEFVPDDLTRDGASAFRQRLVKEFQRLGVSTRLRTDEEIWQEIRHRAIDRFTGAMTNFVSRCRKRNLSLQELDHMLAAHRPAIAMDTEKSFSDVGRSVYEAYLGRLRELGKEDFDGLMWRASATVDRGMTRFVRDRGRETGDLARLRFVLVDEFQDFSSMFAAMLRSIRAVNPEVAFFCVGDDWQAINGFAGADLKYFTGFGEPFRDTRVRAITTNYRSSVAVVQTGNALMQDDGLTASPRPGAPRGEVRLCHLDEFNPSVFERELHQGDELTPAVLRLVRHFLDRGLDVVLLSRRNLVRGYVNYGPESRDHPAGLERFASHIRSFLPEEDRDRVSISTAHRYKGLEKPATVILDAVVGSYPLVHPSWIFLRVFGDSLESIQSEERRLFYVALTRARESLAIITEADRKSPFLDDIEAHASLEILQWASLPAVAPRNDPRVEVRVRGAYEVRDQLKGIGFTYEASGKCWRRTYEQAGFKLEDLLTQPWASECFEISVHSPTGQLLEAVNP